MTISRTAARRLIKQIEIAFSDTSPPPYALPLEQLCPEDSMMFRSRRWQDIVTYRLPYDAVFFFDDESYRYYLPAYLVTALRWPRRAANVRSGSIASLLPPSKKDPELSEFRSRMDAFTQEQKRIIREFLIFMQEFDQIDPRAKKALRRYWNTAPD